VRRLEGSVGSWSETLLPNQHIFTMNPVRTSDVSQRPDRFLGAFEKIAISDPQLCQVCPTVRQRGTTGGSDWTDFLEF
jgi:hypothetical protein